MPIGLWVAAGNPKPTLMLGRTPMTTTKVPSGFQGAHRVLGAPMGVRVP